MTTIKKNGNAITSNLYEYEAMSIFVDGNGIALQNSVTYTPSTGLNSCIQSKWLKCYLRSRIKCK